MIKGFLAEKGTYGYIVFYGRTLLSIHLKVLRLVFLNWSSNDLGLPYKGIIMSFHVVFES